MKKPVTLDAIIDELSRTMDQVNFKLTGRYHDLHELLYDLKELKRTQMPEDIKIPVTQEGHYISFVPFQPNPKRACLCRITDAEKNTHPIFYVSKTTHRKLLSGNHIGEWVPAVGVSKDESRYIACKIVSAVPDGVMLETCMRQLSLENAPIVTDND